MSTLVLNEPLKLDSIAGKALRAATRFWFVTTLIGQMMLVVYVALFYGTTGLRGQVENWNRVLSGGYVRGDIAGNTALIVHLVAAALITAAGLVQLIPQIRERFPRFHRSTGRVYVITAVLTSIAGLYMTWFRTSAGDLAQHIGISLNAMLIVACAYFAPRAAMQRRMSEHRLWALRLFLVVSGTWFFRVFLFFWLIVNQGPVGFDPKTFTGPALTFLVFAQSLLPLLLLELHLRARGASRLAVAAVLVVLTIAMGIGIFAATMGMWLPAIQRVI